MFGKHFNHVLVLTALALMVYTVPDVSDAIVSGEILLSDQPAAVIDSFTPHRRGPENASTSLGLASSTQIGGPQDDRKLGPQEVISVLVKAGIISTDKVDQARALFPAPRQGVPPQQLGSTTPRMGEGRREGSGTVGSSTRMMPPPPRPAPAQSSTTIPRR